MSPSPSPPRPDPAGNDLKWTASTNDIADHFAIERSADSRSWQQLSTVAAVFKVIKN